MTERDFSDDPYFAWRESLKYFEKDRFTHEFKEKIAHNFLTTVVSWCTDEDLKMFFDPDFQPNPIDLEKSLRYGNIEKEIANLFDTTLEKKDGEEFDRRIRAHHDGLMPILTEYLTTSEIEFICSGGMRIDIRETIFDPTFTLWIVGFESLWGRRIRNAYIPQVVRTYSIDPYTGEIDNTTHKIFDGELDAVDTMNTLFGK